MLPIAFFDSDNVKHDTTFAGATFGMCVLALFLDFKKFIRPKKEFIDKELRKLLPKIYYNFIDIFSQKSVNILPPH